MNVNVSEEKVAIFPWIVIVCDPMWFKSEVKTSIYPPGVRYTSEGVRVPPRELIVLTILEVHAGLPFVQDIENCETGPP